MSLEAGLAVQARIDAGEGGTLDDLPHEEAPKQTTLAMGLRVNFKNPRLVAKRLLERCSFLLISERSAQFAVLVNLCPLPREVVSIYVHICSKYQMGQIEVSEEE